MKYLLDLLEKETRIYNNYLDLAVKKKKALIENDMEALEMITGEEKSLSSKVLALEAARMEFLREQGYPADIHISKVLQDIEGEMKKQINDTAVNLRMVLENCKKFHESNSTLLKQSSNYINHMIKVFTNNLNGGRSAPTYSKGAQKLQTGKIADVQG